MSLEVYLQTLIDDVSTTDELIDLDDVTSLFGGDLIKIGNEIVLIESIGVEIPNRLRVRRSLILELLVGSYSVGETVNKVSGDYNIVDNVLTFIESSIRKYSN